MTKAVITIELDFEESGITCDDDPGMVQVVGSRTDLVKDYIAGHVRDMLAPWEPENAGARQGSTENFHAFTNAMDIKVEVDGEKDSH